jgi:cell division septum initiation protein DivIVA
MSELKSRLDQILSDIKTLCDINKQLKYENSELRKELSELRKRERQKGIIPESQKHNTISANDINTLIREVDECIELVKKMA